MLLAISLLGCAGSDIGATPNHPAESPAATFDTTSSDLAERTVQHGQSMGQLDDRDAMMTAENEFLGACEDDWATLSTCMDSFQGCGMGNGMMDGQGSMDDWSQWMGDVSDMFQAHHDGMATCTTVDDCHAQEADWQGQMSGMFDQMGQMDPAWQEDCHW